MEELQLYGANSVISVFRGGGVLYKEILCDVCKQLKVKFNSNSSVKATEQELFLKILTDLLNDDKMDMQALKQITDEAGVVVTNFSKQAPQSALQGQLGQEAFNHINLRLLWLIQHRKPFLDAV